MARTEALTEVRLGAEHGPGCVALVAEAHWNQTADDWRTMLSLGEGFGLVDAQGTLLATSLALPYATGGFGWISMVLVTGSRRRQGLATRLMDSAMQSLAAQKLTAILDATPAGREVYRLLGFQDTWGIDRMQCLGTPAPEPAPASGRSGSIRPMTDADWTAVCALDARSFAADRSGLLAALRKRLPSAALVCERDGAIDGFLLGRDGRLASQLGPCVAGDEATAIALLAGALASVKAPVFLDMPARHDGVRAWLVASGFTVQRPYTRMLLGRSEPYNDVARLFAIAGPELG
ncbi:MAG: GNAT family N-acetyltransferase [Betaproteobacteria bacterium]|nr:GNAT family N-acetyltransferase [Betaproteobacteria bacterium]